jgi:hypothetical protein
MSSVWAPGVWAPDVWFDNVWFGMGDGEPEPEPEPAVRADTVDLTPWDFLQQFEKQKRQWLKARTKLEAAKALALVYEALPPEEAAEIEVPVVQEARPSYDLPAVPLIDYEAMMRNARVVDALLTKLLRIQRDALLAQEQADEDDLAVALLSQVH